VGLVQEHLNLVVAPAGQAVARVVALMAVVVAVLPDIPVMVAVVVGGSLLALVAVAQAVVAVVAVALGNTLQAVVGLEFLVRVLVVLVLLGHRVMPQAAKVDLAAEVAQLAPYQVWAAPVVHMAVAGVLVLQVDVDTVAVLVAGWLMETISQ
jgi:hypothetical protein